MQEQEARHAFAAALAAGRCTPAQALSIFDALPAMDPQGLTGAWAGTGFPTGHPLDGALEAYHWHGKRFDSAEHVHPLVFRSGGRLVHLNPPWLAAGVPLLLRWPALKSPRVARWLHWLLPLLATHSSRARLRTLRHRGCETAAMLYDDAPIIDVFRQVQPGTVLGLMDLKGLQQPFFFVLRRER